MNLKTYIKSIAVAVVFFAVASCESFIDENLNPSLTLSNPPQVILPAIEAQLGFQMGGDLYRYSGLWSQQIAAQNGRQTETYDRYILQPTEVNAVWRTAIYGGVLADIEEILKKPTDQVHPHYFGIAKAIKAFTYSILVDYWGDVPFFQSIKGAERNFQPDVDDDAVIYPQLITLLDEAIAHLKETSPLAAVNSDYIYNNSPAKWIRFANTLKLRLYLHMANVPGFDVGVIATFVNSTPADQFMTAIADDFQLAFESLSGKQNPTHQFILSRTDDIATSSTIINLMTAKVDPRRPSYFTPYPFSPGALAAPKDTTKYKGLDNGTGGGPSNNLSRLHTYVRGAVTSTTIPAGPALTVNGQGTSLAYNGATPVNMLTFAEYNFIRAELALRYGAPGNAQEFFQAGIKASMSDAGIGATQADAYVVGVGSLTGAIEGDLQKIIEEKYIANFMVAGEPWTDWRRTGYPVLRKLPATISPGNNGEVPRALMYPQQEVDANPKLAALQRSSLSDKRVFWDTRTTGQQ